MAIYYHGSSVLFDSFDLSHALEGDGKAKEEGDASEKKHAPRPRPEIADEA